MTDEQTKTSTRVVIFINDQRHEAPRPVMTGAEIKALGDIPPENRLFREVPGPRDDVPVADDEVVELRNGDRFYDLPRGVHGAPTLEEAVGADLEWIRRDYGPVETRPQPDGSLHVLVGPLPLPSGWFPASGRILVVVPPGYPSQRPSGFFSEPGILAGGGPPRGSGANQLAGETWTLFCWNPANWDPTKDTLWKYVKLMAERFKEVA
jgi:Prokaryotic E2 family E/Multiubiquitin